MKRLLLLVCFSWLGTAASAQRSEIFITDGAAVKGYDVVAYFSEKKPVKGDKQFTHYWKGAEWFFASKQNLELFKGSPEKYAPQYGGYCAYGTSRGYKASTSPDAFTIADGKLYLNYNQEVRNAWDKDRQAFIEKADNNWPRIKDKG
jgi:YHS domain-containing protein